MTRAKSSKRAPFFARFLVKQDLKKIGGQSLAYTMKYPSDGDDYDVTMKYPSDDDEAAGI